MGTCETIKDGFSFTQEELQRERWLPVVSYGGAYIGLYQVSNLGRVRSLDRYVNVVRKDGARQVRKLKGKLLTPATTKDGYYQVFLCAGGVRKLVYIHRLVAEAFLKNPENKQQLNHIDGNKQNNAVKNLEWSTSANT